MNRRSFFRSLGGLAATAVIAPYVSLDDITAFFAPPRRGLTIAQITAVAYDQFLKSRQAIMTRWADVTFLREIQRQGSAQ